MNKRLDALFELAAGQQNAASTRLADNADIRAQTHDLPFVSAARMHFAQPYYVAHINFQRHRGVIIGQMVG